MKVAMLACDLLTICVLVAWLRSTRRSPWLALVYAWNPLVILEIAHSGHIDALGALWIAVSAWMLSTGRGMRAAVAFVLAVASKLLPIVLLPLFWKRIRVARRAVAALVLAALYFPFRSAGTLPLGAIRTWSRPSVSTGRCSRRLPALTPQGAAAVAVLAGLAVAAWMRSGDRPDDPGRLGLADGRLARRRAGRLSVVPPVLHAVPLHPRAVPLVVWTYTALPVYSSGTSQRTGTVGRTAAGAMVRVRSVVGANRAKVLKVLRAGARGAGQRCRVLKVLRSRRCRASTLAPLAPAP